VNDSHEESEEHSDSRSDSPSESDSEKESHKKSQITIDHKAISSKKPHEEKTLSSDKSVSKEVLKPQ
jgi:hypothetical protein